MSENEQISMLALWAALEADEHYADLATYIKNKNAELSEDFTEFKASVYDDISPEARANLEGLITSICHPPPGCGGTPDRAT